MHYSSYTLSFANFRAGFQFWPGFVSCWWECGDIGSESMEDWYRLKQTIQCYCTIKAGEKQPSRRYEIYFDSYGNAKKVTIIT